MKGRPVTEAVFPAEIQQRKAVAEYQQIPFFLPAHLAKIRIQFGKLRQILRQIGPKIRRVGRVGGAQGVTNGPAELLRLHRGGPDMLVILYLVAVVVMAVVVIVVIAFVFIGPDQLPVYAKKLGKMLRELKKYTGAASEEIQKNVVEPLNEIQAPLKEAVAPLTDIKKDIDNSVKDVTKSFTGIGKTSKEEAAKAEQAEEVTELEEVEELPEETPAEAPAAEAPKAEQTPAAEPVKAEEKTDSPAEAAPVAEEAAPAAEAAPAEEAN